MICRGFFLATDVLIVSRLGQNHLLNALNVNVNVKGFLWDLKPFFEFCRVDFEYIYNPATDFPLFYYPQVVVAKISSHVPKMT